MNWIEIILPYFLKALLWISVALLFYVLTQSVFTKTTLKPTEAIQAIAALIVAVIAYWGLSEYKQIRRPYVSLMNVEAKSNLADNNIFIKVPDEVAKIKANASGLAELKGNIGKYVPSLLFFDAPDSIKDIVEEILVDLHFKNTGPVAATQCQIRTAHLSAHGEKPLSDLWHQLEEHDKQIEANEKLSEKEKPLKKEIYHIAENIVLNPQQEQTFNFMFHRKASGFERGDRRFVLCDIRYNSIKDKPSQQVQQDQDTNTHFKRTYRILNLYRIWYAAAWSDILYSNLIKSDIPKNN